MCAASNAIGENRRAGAPTGRLHLRAGVWQCRRYLAAAGYLKQVYALVRAQGGVCIADEVQVGYGRMGHFFWGFEEQGVVPDIITMAKGMGNGQPLGAVITRREIAEALEAEGYFFSSAGGSPVSCQIGMAVLDVMEEEKPGKTPGWWAGISRRAWKR
jgi:4-aminobutyrate aminotransferase-like enzyme